MSYTTISSALLGFQTAFKRLAPIALILLIALHTLQYNWMSLRSLSVPNYDGLVYFSGARYLVEEHNPYLDKAYLYPPLLALILTPLTLLPTSIASVCWMASILISAFFLIFLLRHLLPLPLAICSVLLFTPVWMTFWSGQVAVLIAIVFMLSIIHLRRGATSRASMWLLFGTLIKITPALSLVNLLVRASWRVRVITIAAGLVMIILTLPAISLTVWAQGTIYAAETTQSWTHPLSISWPSFVLRWYDVPNIILLITIFLPAVVITLWRGYNNDQDMALAATILVPILITRVAWIHYTVHALPALALIWSYSPRGRWLSTLSWCAITLVGGWAITVVITLCWIATCWPRLLINKAHALGR